MSSELTEAIQVRVGSEASFVTADQVQQSLSQAGVDEATTSAVVDNYQTAQLRALKAGLLLAAFIAVGALVATRHLPGEPLGPRRAERVDDAGA